jgi:hypothetical protein
VDHQAEKAFGQALNHVPGDGHGRGGAGDRGRGVDHRHARFRTENQLVDTLEGVLERADGLGILHPVGLFAQLGFTAPDNFGNFPHDRQIVAAVRRIDDGFDGVGRHGGKACHIGPLRIDIMRMGKRHDEIDIGQGIANPCRPDDMFQTGLRPFQGLAVHMIHQVGAGAEIGPPPPQIHHMFAVPVEHGNVGRCALDRLFHQGGGNGDQPVRILAASRIREQLDGPVVLQGHAGVFQHLKGRVMDFLLIGCG